MISSTNNQGKLLNPLLILVDKLKAHLMPKFLYLNFFHEETASAKQWRRQISTCMKSYCRQNDWQLIEHRNITGKGLNKGGLHLNTKGNERLFKNFQENLGWNNALTTNALPADSARGNAEASLASNLKDAELYSALPSERGFKLASLNIFKLTTHMDKLRILLANNDIDIISINETKLDEVISDNEVSIPGYDIIRRDRLSNGGGGICFYVRSSIEYSLRNDLSEETLENLCLEIRKPKSKPFVVVTWYRPPDSPIGIFSHFENLVGKLDSENIEYYLMGDINCDMIATRYDNNTQKLKSIADVYGLQQLITEPTRITQTSATCIDLIYTNCADKIVCSGVRHISISDHSMVFAYRKLSINGTSRGHNVISYKNFRKFNKENFRNDIASQNWDQIYNSTDPNEMWSQWKCLFLPIAN